MVVALAGQHAASWEWDNRQRYIAAAMSWYAHKKLELFSAARDRVATHDERLAQYRFSLIALLVVLVGLTILLVLMAIERNTRRPLTQGS